MSEFGPSNREILSVSELNRSARRLLEGEFPMIFVEGEISNFTRPTSGHWYLTLKDDGAQLRCAMFVNRNRLVRFTPKNGLQVVIRGKVSLYEGRGEFQLIAEFMEEAGDGALRRAFDALKEKLQSQGLFSADNKKPLPSLPQHIGVITSPTGAAIRDVLTVLKRRFPAIRVSVRPVQVQGEEAPAQIVAALEFANRYHDDPFDVILLTRGGGSLEDLWSFNTEPVARAIFASALPVVSAVGHESDFTISDFVADLRAPTPSAAAEILSPDGWEWLESLRRLERGLISSLQSQVGRHKLHLGHITKRLRHPGSRLQDLSQRIDGIEIQLRATFRRYLGNFRLNETHNRLHLAMARRMERANARVTLATTRLPSPVARLAQYSTRITHMDHRLKSRARTDLARTSERVSNLASRLESVNPAAILERGYAIVRIGDHILTDAADVSPGQQITATLKRGKVTAQVTDTEKKE